MLRSSSSTSGAGLEHPERVLILHPCYLVSTAPPFMICTAAALPYNHAKRFYQRLAIKRSTHQLNVLRPGDARGMTSLSPHEPTTQNPLLYCGYLDFTARKRHLSRNQSLIRRLTSRAHCTSLVTTQGVPAHASCWGSFARSLTGG